MPNKIKGPPTIEAVGMFSENIKKANTEAIIGSPSGIEATAVGGRCFNEYVRKLWPRIDGNMASARNQTTCSSSKTRGFVLKRKQTSPIVKAATIKATLLYVIESVNWRTLDA